MINQFGNIFEGIIDPKGKLNGFCVCYIGIKNIINVGYYKND